MAWEPVWSGTTETEAEIVAGRLRAERIRARVIPSAAPLRASYGAQWGERWLVVAQASRAAEARRVLSARETGGIVSPEDFSDPVGANWRQMKQAWPWFVVAGLVGAIFLMLQQL